MEESLVNRRVSCLVILWFPAVLLAQDAAPGPHEEALVRTYTINLTAGLTSTFQPPLGPVFGAGPAVEDRLLVSVNNVFRKDDSVIGFGWNTTDAPSIT